MRQIKFAWICRNKTFNTIERVELTDTQLLNGDRPSWITSSNCEILAKILPTEKLDKNGVMIWEGDIIKQFGNPIPMIVTFTDYQFMLANKWNIGGFSSESLEVIGTIYGNNERCYIKDGK